MRRDTTLVNMVPPKSSWSVGTAWKRGVVLVDAPPMSGAVVTAVSIMSESRGGAARLLDTMVLRCDGGTVLLFVWRERFDWGGSIRLDCPGSIGPLDNAALARRPIEPFRAGKVRFFWRERLYSMISEHKSFANGQGLNPFNDIG